MRKFILIAGFALVSVAAQAGDRSLSLGGGETTRVRLRPRLPRDRKLLKPRRPRKHRNMSNGPRSSSPSPRRRRPETSKTETARPRAARAARMQRSAAGPASAGPGRPMARRTALMSRSAGPHRMRYGIRTRIISALHRHGIYW